LLLKIIKQRHLIRILPVLAVFLLGFLITIMVASAGRDTSSYYNLERAFDMEDIGVQHPAGLAYSPNDGVFLVVDKSNGAKDLTLITPHESLAGTISLPAAITAIDPLNMAFDAQTNYLYLLEQDTKELVQVQVNLQGQPEAASESIQRHDLESLGLGRVQGITVDPNSGQLYLLDGDQSRMVGLSPDVRQSFDGSLALEQGRVNQKGLRGLGDGKPQGIAHDPNSNHFYILSASNKKLVEVTETGQTVATYDLTALNLENPTGMAVAPSGDSTDDPSILNLYITDSGQTTGQVESGQNGKILELSFQEPFANPAPQAMLSTTRVNTIYNSAWSPPSPDTSGIKYIPTSGNMLYADSEVNEMMTIYAGANVFESTITGTLLYTATTDVSGFSDEPTGLGWNPFNGHLYVSDDTGTRGVYDVDLGNDGKLGTVDDGQICLIPTGGFGSNDPEGVAYGPGKLFVLDGVNDEVYTIEPGPDGVFNSQCGGANDDVVTSFDTFVFGAEDPEGIDYNAGSDTLFIVSASASMVFETTTTGAVVNTIDIGFLKRLASPLALAVRTRH
jgi:uncharacterized protein YjiK